MALLWKRPSPAAALAETIPRLHQGWQQEVMSSLSLKNRKIIDGLGGLNLATDGVVVRFNEENGRVVRPLLFGRASNVLLRASGVYPGGISTLEFDLRYSGFSSSNLPVVHPADRRDRGVEDNRYTLFIDSSAVTALSVQVLSRLREADASGSTMRPPIYDDSVLAELHGHPLSRKECQGILYAITSKPAIVQTWGSSPTL